jgi:hypothetical protein
MKKTVALACYRVSANAAAGNPATGLSYSPVTSTEEIMSIGRIRAASAALVRTRTAALAAVPALAASGLLVAGVPAAQAAPAACPTATQIVTTINSLAGQAQALNGVLGTLTTSSDPQQVMATAQSLVNGLNNMSSDLSAGATAIDGCSALSKANSETVASAFSNLAQVDLQFLSTIIGKHGIFAQFAQTAPIAAALRSFEGAFDYYSFGLANIAQSPAGSITNSQSTVNTALDNTVNTYQQICIPSPLYPIVMPICISG